MGLLFPAMLAGLAALAVPAVIHLIARQRFPVQDFPAIRLLRAEPRTNTFAWLLIDRWQLLLRLLVLAVLVLAMARPFAGWLSSGPAPRNLVVVIDASASMRLEAGGRSLLDRAKARAGELMAEVRAPGRCQLIVAGDRLEAHGGAGGDAAACLAALPAIQPSAGAGCGLVAAVAEACATLEGRREHSSQVVVLCDLRESAFAAREARDLRRIAAARSALGGKLDLVFIDVAPSDAANLALLDTRVRGGSPRLGEDAHVLARVLNDGPEERTASLRLSVAGRNEPGRQVAIPAGGEAVVDLTAPVNRQLRAFAEVSLRDGGAIAHDDSRLAPFTASDPCRVLVVRGDQQAATASALDRLGGGPASAAALAEERTAVDGAAILRFALNPGRELGAGAGTGIDTQACGVDALPAQALSRFELVILYDVTALPDKAVADLAAFLDQGRALLIIPSAGIQPLVFNRLLASPSAGRPALAAASVGNERDFPTPVGIDPGWLAHPALAPFRDRLQGDLSVLRFARIRDLTLLPGSEVILRSADGLPLAVESQVGAGRSITLAFGLELDRGNVARTRAFPVLLWRLVDHLTGRLRRPPPDVLLAGRSAVLDAGDAAFALADTLELAAAGGTKARTMPIGAGRSVLVADQPAPLAPGAYTLQRAATDSTHGGYVRPVAVVGDPGESRLARLPPARLEELCPGARVLAEAASGDLAPRGGEFFALLVLLLAGLWFAEAIVGHLTAVRRERARDAEAAA